MADSNAKLDSILRMFESTPDNKKYLFIRELKAYLNKNPSLRSYDHNLFVSITKFHVDNVMNELEELRALLQARLLKTDYQNLTTSILSGYNWLNVKIKERIVELEIELERQFAFVQKVHLSMIDADKVFTDAHKESDLEEREHYPLSAP
jgi:hypothetical protein